jgi:hypothetical protein
MLGKGIHPKTTSMSYFVAMTPHLADEPWTSRNTVGHQWRYARTA